MTEETHKNIENEKGTTRNLRERNERIDNKIGEVKERRLLSDEKMIKSKKTNPENNTNQKENQKEGNFESTVRRNTRTPRNASNTRTARTSETINNNTRISENANNGTITSKNVNTNTRNTRGINSTRSSSVTRATINGREMGNTKTTTGRNTRNTRTTNASKTGNQLMKLQTQEKSLINTQKNKDIFKKPKLKIIPLGGLHEIGKNITVFEYADEIIIVDCGLSFPEDDMLGIDLVIPDITYLQKNVSKIKGLFITHGHEDHIGSVPYLLKQINVPIYAPRLAMGLIKNKLEEHKILRSAKLNEVIQGQVISLGKYFKVEIIQSTHSVPDSVMLAITTPEGIVLHTGDFKVDYTPIDGNQMNFGRIAELGNQGILALMSDSTNAERKGFTMSESSVGEVFDKLFLHCTKRIVVATFASNVHRVQQIVNASIKYGRKVAVCGRSMINMINTAKELGYIDCPEDLFIDIDMMSTYNDEQLVIITTGSQGETMSALTRMAAGEHRKVKITQNDLVIISANPIPGNEKYVSRVIDDLMQIGAEVVYSALQDVHVSGHACQEEQKLILALTRPQYFIPVHGEYRQLMAHGETAKSMGIPSKNVLYMSNGKVLEIDKNEARFAGMVPNGKVLVDGLGVGDVGNIVLRDRQHLSQDGLIVIVLTLDSSTGEVVAGPDVISRGFVYVREAENLMDDVKGVVRHEIRKCEENSIRDWATIKSTVKDNLRDYIFTKTKRNPMIIPIIMEV